MKNNRHNVTPDPSRITSGLRDTGYVLNTAIADIVDNSIAAEAENIEIELTLDPHGRVRFSVADDGIGMSPEGIINALTYGSEQRANRASLGKFGLGLKTASTAFAKRLMITSRGDLKAPASTLVWDLDDVETFGWTVEELPSPDDSDVRILDTISPNGTGTVVRWQKVDRVFDRQYRSPTGTHAVNAVSKKVESLVLHLSMVFQRFLDHADDRARNVNISINGQAVKGWNPFGFEAQVLLSKTLEVEFAPGEQANMQLRAVVLPRKAELLDIYGESGPKEARLENDYQGIYVYRENRLIHGPDWLGIWIKEPHFTLSRVELSFDHQLDEAFQVDIKKSRINLDDTLVQAIRQMLNPPRKEAENRYRDGRRTALAKVDSPTMHSQSNASISEVSPQIPQSSLQEVHPEDGTAVIENNYGPVRVKYIDNHDGGVFVEAVDELAHGVFYEPAYIGQNPGVRISKTHPYYEKVYLPNKSSGVTIQALDSLLWALASAEFRSTQESTRQIFEDIRVDVSRALNRLVADLPEAEELD